MYEAAEENAESDVMEVSEQFESREPGRIESWGYSLSGEDTRGMGGS